ncbi:MAG: ABC transporter ATP-binding protein [Candidatus Binataceae bacterium]
MAPRFLRGYFARLAALSPIRLIGIIALMVFVSLSEGAGIMLLFPTLQIAGFNLKNQGEAGRYERMITAALNRVGIHPTLAILLGLFVAVVALRTLAGQFERVAAAALGQNFEHVLRMDLYSAIVNANWLFICRSRASDLTHALTAEIERVGLLTHDVLFFAAGIILSSIYILVAFELSAAMTLLVLASAAILALLARRFSHRLRQSGEDVSSGIQQLYAASVEHLQSLKAVKTYSAQAGNLRVYSGLSETVSRANVEACRRENWAGSWLELGSALILGAVIYASIELLRAPPAEILILLLLFARVMPRLMAVHTHYRNFLSLFPSFVNVMELRRRCAAAAEPPPPHNKIPALGAGLEFLGVSFSYRPGIAPALDAIDLTIPAGQVTALVGPSGAGKSTLADIAAALLTADAGTLRIGGIVFSAELAQAWRQQIGYVGPDTFLLHDTIRNNLLWAKPGADEDEMRAALRDAAAEEFVDALPDGLETLVGDRGALLSQGERQRLALARALLRRPAILILDEATNSLDAENESRVLAAINRLRGRITVLLIAHRLSTVRWADLIYVFEDGRIVESGGLELLAARPGGRFRALCEAQSITV